MAEWNLDDTDTDTDTSSPSASIEREDAVNYTTMYQNNHPLVLELHELEKDEPATGTNTTPNTAAPAHDTKSKKKKKKNRLFSRDAKEVVSAASVSSVETGVEIASKEEFYDARESYHGIENTPQLQVIGSHVASPVLTNSLGSATASLPTTILDSLKITGSTVHHSEHSQQGPGSQSAIQKPTAPPS